MRRLLRPAILILSLICMAVPGRTWAQSLGPVYVVQQGDTLWGIAQEFGTDAATLASANGMDVNAPLMIGAQLVIPGFEGVSGVLVTRDVGYGESLQSLGLRYRIATDTLTRLNRLVNPERIYVGESLILPEQDNPPQGAAGAVAVSPEEGEGPLGMAIRAGEAPWAVAALSGMGYRMWLVPGETAFVPAQGREPTALPDPVRSIDVRPLPAVQGRTEIMQIALDSPALAEGSLGPWMLHFEPVHDKDLVALQGVYAMADPGLYDLVLKVTSPQGQVLFQYSQPVFVASGGYPFDPILEVAPDTIDPNVTGPENDQYAAIVAPVTPDKLWDGVFRFPTDYTKSFPSRFGSRRNYNGTGYNSYHSGLDLYGDTGKPIYAAARGRVVFTGETTIRGNLTILDHGWGVYTAYLHQSEIKVSVGEVVDAGQLIGLVGATGRVTGPHLHWEVLVGGIPVNPIEWTQTAFP